MSTARGNAKRWWRYFMFWTWFQMDKRMDPKIQLEQALEEAKLQHRLLTEQAASVIANQKQTEMRLNAKIQELGKVSASTRQALLMADDAAKSGDTDKSQEFTRAAESFANRLIALEAEVGSLKAVHLQATAAADQAKAAVNQNSQAMQNKLSEKQKLLSQLDQAKMQEQMNAAMSSLSATVGQDVPSLEEVREKIEARYAKAAGMTELEGSTVDAKMLEVEREVENSAAKARLSQIRSQLDLGSAPIAAVTEEPQNHPATA